MHSWQIAWEYHPMPCTWGGTPMHHSPHCALKPLQHCSSQASMWKMHELLSNHAIFQPSLEIYMPWAWGGTPMHHSLHCALKPLQHCSSQASMWKMYELLSNHAIFQPSLEIYVPHQLGAYSASPPKRFSAPSHCSHFWPLHALC